MDLLKDLLPAKARLTLYVTLSVASAVWAAYEAAGGDLRTAIPAVMSALVHALASGNVNLGTGGRDLTEDIPGDL